MHPHAPRTMAEIIDGVSPRLHRRVLPPARKIVRALASVFDDVRSSDGHTYRVNRNIHPYDYVDVMRGSFERGDRDLLRQMFVPDNSIIEIGSNIGIVATAAFEEKLADGGHMVCLEPNPDVLPALNTNMERAQKRWPQRSVEILPMAVTADAGCMSEFRARASLCSGLSGNVVPADSDRVMMVPTVSLTALAKKYASKGASLICDAEGAEIDMIFQEKSAFNNIRQILIELHEPWLTGRQDTPDSLAAEIQTMGFKLGARAENTFYFSKPSI